MHAGADHGAGVRVVHPLHDLQLQDPGDVFFTTGAPALSVPRRRKRRGKTISCVVAFVYLLEIDRRKSERGDRLRSSGAVAGMIHYGVNEDQRSIRPRGTLRSHFLGTVRFGKAPFNVVWIATQRWLLAKLEVFPQQSYTVEALLLLLLMMILLLLLLLLWMRSRRLDRNINMTATHARGFFVLVSAGDRARGV